MADTGLASAAQIYWRLFEMHGLDPAPLFREAGIDPSLLREPEARVPVDRVERLWSCASQLLPAPAIGLDAARCWHPGNLGVLGHAWLSSSTLRTGLRRLERYWRLLGERSNVTLEEMHDGLSFSFHRMSAAPAVDAVAADIVLSILLAMCRLNTGDALHPLRVSLRRAPPGDAGPWRAFFGCPVRFSAGLDSVVLATRDVDRPLPSSNRPLAGVLDALLAEQLARLDRRNIPARCKAVLLEELVSGPVPEEEMARQINVSRRTLQRKLADEGTTYKKLVDDTRREMALRYLEGSRFSATEITFLLGFSQQSAFTRAFKRWTGATPSQYRDRPAPGASR